MRLLGFNADDYGRELAALGPGDELRSNQFVAESADCIRYVPNGRSLCWKCACKHLGAAAAYAAELHGYPANFIRMIGELYHAYQECPDRELSEQLRATYLHSLETGVAPNFDPLLASFYAKFSAWRESWTEAEE